MKPSEWYNREVIGHVVTKDGDTFEVIFLFLIKGQALFLCNEWLAGPTPLQETTRLLEGEGNEWLDGFFSAVDKNKDFADVSGLANTHKVRPVQVPLSLLESYTPLPGKEDLLYMTKKYAA